MSFTIIHDCLFLTPTSPQNYYTLTSEDFRLKDSIKKAGPFPNPAMNIVEFTYSLGQLFYHFVYLTY